jgi:hypothetical protein
MAVLQISKIQVRRGQESQTGIPTLSAGEFAWAIDTQKVYIGNGSVAEGAPFVGNTRLLTENDANNIFQLASTYSFDGTTAKTVKVQTGATVNTPVLRTLQQKLDDQVTLFDFGCAGDGVTNDTKALQNAIDQIYLNSADKSFVNSKRQLSFPAGTYLITGTIFVPPYANLVGAGPDKTVIVQSGLGLPIFQTCDSSSTQFSRYLWPNIQATSQPKRIAMSGMTMKYSSNVNQIGADGMLDLDCVLDTNIDNMKFLGVATTPMNDGVKAIQIRGQGATTSENVQINRCTFEKLNVGVYSDYDIKNLKIQNSKFYNMGKGIAVATTLPQGDNMRTRGPVDVKITNNNFDTIYQQAVFVGSNTGNVSNLVLSQNNNYYNCGNMGALSTDQSQVYEVITFFSSGNVSSNDYFSRDEANANGVPSPMIPAVKGHVSLNGHKVNRITLPTNLTTNIVSLAKSEYSEQLNFDYVATQTNLTRIGKLQILVNDTSATVYDSFQYQGTAIGDTMRFTATLASNVITLQAINLNNSQVTLSYKFNQLY